MNKPRDESDVEAFCRRLLESSEELRLAAEGIRKAFANLGTTLFQAPACGSCKAPIHQMHQQECFLSGRVGRWACGLEKDVPEKVGDDE